MPKKQTKQEFLEKLFEQNNFYRNGDFEVIGEYVNSKTPILCKCPVHGPWDTTTPNDLLSKNRGCPKCAETIRKESYLESRLKKGKNDLVSLYPNLINEWDKTKNSKYDISKLTIHCKYKVWWKCSVCGYEWQATISNRTINDSGCPYCAGRTLIVGKNDLESQYPLLAAEWHPTKNNGLLPSQVMKASNKKVWWKCEKGHEWQAKVESRTINHNGCPECAKWLSTSYPEQAILYYLSQNYETSSRVKFENFEVDIYIPEYDIGIEYDGMLYHNDSASVERAKKKDNFFKKKGINILHVKEVEDYCVDKENEIYIVPKGNYKTLDDAIIRTIKWVQSQTNTSFDIYVNQKEDRLNILNMFKLAEVENSFLSMYPELAKEWNYEKNDNLRPDFFKPQSTTTVWWKGKCGHEWRAAIGNRTINGASCPYCSNHKVLKGFNDLATTNPNLIKMWDYDKNVDILPTEVLAGSNKKAWWKCTTCGYSWEAVISSVSHGHGCPFCAGKIASKGNNLLDLYPDLCEEWDYEKNENLLPNNLLPKSGMIVWWKCKDCGYSWKTKISIRTNGSGCPKCANKSRGKHTGERLRGTTLTEERKCNLSQREKGERNPRYRHDIKTETIIDLLEQGYTQKEVAEKLGCSATLIQKRKKEYLK